jgi:hypothetical protein
MAVHSAGPQATGEFPAQLAPALDKEGLIDRLVAHPHHRIVWELDTQATSDLFGRPPLSVASFQSPPVATKSPHPSEWMFRFWPA